MAWILFDLRTTDCIPHGAVQRGKPPPSPPPPQPASSHGINLLLLCYLTAMTHVLLALASASASAPRHTKLPLHRPERCIKDLGEQILLQNTQPRTGGFSAGQWPERRERESASSLKMVPKTKSVPVMGVGGVGRRGLAGRWWGGSVPF